MRDAKIRFRGLGTTPASTSRPDGSLLEASNVILRRPGRVEPRPGFDHRSGVARSPKRLLPFNQKFIAAEAGDRTQTETGTRILSRETNADLLFDATYIRGAVVRSALYLSTTDTLRKISSIDGGSDPQVDKALGAGAHPVIITDTTVTGDGPAPIDTYYLYQAVHKRVDANGLVVRSAPSNPFPVNTVGQVVPTGLSVFVRLTPTAYWQATTTTSTSGDWIELYRSVGDPAAPSEDLYLAVTAPITSTDISAGYKAVGDTVPEASLGQALYTNEEQEGVEGTHITPPSANCLAEFAGSLFLGNLTYRPTLTVQVSNTASSIMTTNVTATNGSVTATVASATGLTAGMVLKRVASDFFSGILYIASISGTTITLNAAWPGSTGTVSCYFIPGLVLKNGSTIRPVVSHRSPSFGLGFQRAERYVYGTVSTDSLVNTPTLTAFPYVSINSTDEGLAETAATPWSMQIEDLPGNTNTTEVFLSGGVLTDPPLPTYTPGGTGKALASGVQPNGLTWSNDREPEHFTLVNEERIGADAEPIQALLATKNALIIFKTDGCWRLSGAGAESGFRIDKLDLDLKILAPDAATVFGPMIAVWSSSRGILLGDENGFVSISDGLVQEQLSSLEDLIRAGTINPDTVWAATNRRTNSALFGVGTSRGAYVFSGTTSAWTTWFPSETVPYAMEHPATGKLLIPDSRSGFSGLRFENSEGYDRKDTGVTLSVVSGNTVNIAFSVLTEIDAVAVGDAIVQGLNTFLVVEVIDSDTVVLNAPAAAGAASYYQGFECRLSPDLYMLGVPGVAKCYGEGAIWFESTTGVCELELEFSSDTRPTVDTVPRRYSETRPSPGRADAVRFVTPQNQARATRLQVALSIRQTLSSWAVEGLAVNQRPMLDRVMTKR